MIPLRLSEVAELTDRADALTLPELGRAVRALPDPSECSNLDALVSDVKLPPPELGQRVADVRAKLGRARIDIAAGRLSQAGAAAEVCVGQARALQYPPLLAEALLALGHARMLDHRAAAVPILVEATVSPVPSATAA